VDPVQLPGRDVEQLHSPDVRVLALGQTGVNRRLAALADHDDSAERGQQGQVVGELHARQHFQGHVDPGWGYAADLVEVTGCTVIKRMERRWSGVVPAPPATGQWRLPARRRPSTPQRRQADAAGGAVYQHRVSSEDVAAVVRGVLGDEDPRAGLVGDVVCKGLELCGGMGEGVGGVRCRSGRGSSGRVRRV